ncbi:MAG: hypothetical protein FWF66_02195 [Candidatus Bathyarchaeota archaeon]|nr:hypothetical protein [Candidatus Termiticorpusculum sp.]
MRNFYLKYSHNTSLQLSGAEIQKSNNLASPVREIDDTNQQSVEIKMVADQLFIVIVN